MRINSVWLICAREVRERTRSRMFRVVLILTVAVVVLAVVIPSIVSSKDKTPSYAVGIVDPAPAGLITTLEQLGPSVGAHLAVLPFPNKSDAVSSITSGGIVAAVIPDDRILVKTAINPSLVSETSQIASALARVTASYQDLQTAGLATTQIQQALGHRTLPIQGLQPPAHGSAKNAAAAGGSMIVLFILLNLYGAFILNGVIEEKTSRVVEILLSTVRTEELLLGKVLGIGIVGTLQGAILAIATFVARANTHNLSSGSLSVAVVLYTLLWFIIGFGIYAWMYACAGALVSRSEDSQSLVFLLQIPLFASYFIAALSAVNGPNTALTAASLFPPTAPMTMLERMAAQEVPFWQVGLSIGLCILTILVVMRLAVVIFRGGVLKSGARVKIRDAWRVA